MFIVILFVGMIRLERLFLNWKVSIVVCLLIFKRLFSGVMIGIVRVACLELEGIKKLSKVWKINMIFIVIGLGKFFDNLVMVCSRVLMIFLFLVMMISFFVIVIINVVVSIFLVLFLKVVMFFFSFRWEIMLVIMFSLIKSLVILLMY